MWQKDIAFYLGEESPDGFTGYIVDDSFFLILSVNEGMGNEEGHKALQSIKTDLLSVALDSLAQFELKISEVITKNNLPTNFSLAAGYLKNDVLYLKTGGTASVLIYRKRQLAKIVDKEQAASGYVQSHDLFIFTTDDFIRICQGEAGIRKVLDNRKPHEIVDEITPQLKSRGDQNTIALFVKFNPVEAVSESEAVVVPENTVGKLKNLFLRLQNNNQNVPEKKRTMTFIVVGLIFAIFLWSVVFGVRRRQDVNVQNKISAVKELITQKLNQADEVAFLNLPRAMTIIASAKGDVDKLKKDIGNRKEIGELDNLITDEENKILKVEQKNADEFFDLTVDNQQAKGNALYLDGDTVAILDNGQKTIYHLSLTKKSLDKKSGNEIKNAQLIASNQNELIFYVEGAGIYKIDISGKLTKVIDKDSDWGVIGSLTVYNSNLYLLDPPKDSIYKYVAADNGYSTRSAYFKGGDNGLKGASSLAIDSSVYVGFTDHIFKFTAGSQDDFQTVFPNPSVNIQKIFTNKEVEKVYAWDKVKGSIYILNKNGTYEQEISSSILKQANDFVVFDNAAYILAGPKIYQISLE